MEHVGRRYRRTWLRETLSVLTAGPAGRVSRGSLWSSAARPFVIRLRHRHATLPRQPHRLLVPRIHVPHRARTWVGGQNPLQPAGRVVAAVGDDDHAGVQTVADADAAAVVDADPPAPQPCWPGR